MISVTSGLGIYADAGILTFGIQFVGFLVAAALQTEVFYDVLGGLNFLAVAVLSCVSPTSSISVDKESLLQPTKELCFVALFVISRGWLLAFLAWRAHDRKGDARFDGVRDVPSTFFVFWMVQAIWVYCISLPVLAVAGYSVQESAVESGLENEYKTTAGISSLLLFGMAISIYMEIRSDITKAQWVSRGRPGGFCTDGLWKISRHPNYAGEILTWIFATLFATSVCDWSSVVAAISSISPLFTMQILLNTSGTGVWNAEGKNLKRYYEHQDENVVNKYKEYRRTTPPVFPTLVIPYENIPLDFQRQFCFEWERYEYNPSKACGREKCNKQS